MCPSASRWPAPRASRRKRSGALPAADLSIARSAQSSWWTHDTRPPHPMFVRLRRSRWSAAGSSALLWATSGSPRTEIPKDGNARGRSGPMAEGLIEQHLEQNQPVAKVLHGQKRSEPKEWLPETLQAGGGEGSQRRMTQSLLQSDEMAFKAALHSRAERRQIITIRRLLKHG